MKILYTGPLTPGDTCALRGHTLQRLGHEVHAVDYLPFVRATVSHRVQWRLRLGSMVQRYNAALVTALQQRPDLLWVDKGLFVYPAVLQAARAAGVRWLVHYSPDNHALPANVSRHLWRGLSSYDVVVTTKAHNVTLLRGRGARHVLLSGNAFDPTVHRPIELGPAERQVLTCDVSFVGRFEPARAQLLRALAASGLRVAVRGPGWDRARVSDAATDPVFGDDYAKVVSAAAINLGLLSRQAGDDSTQRTVEIPACAGFMLAEHTAEQESYFADGREAVFFRGIVELRAQIERYLPDAPARQRIARAGRQRCLDAGYSYDARLQQILSTLAEAA